MTITNLIIFGLAVWRISSLFVNEKGPANVFIKMRELAGISHDPDGNISMIPDRFFAGVLSCVWCCSIWVSFFLTAIWLFYPEIALRTSIPFAFSAVAIIIEAKIKK